LTSHAHSSESTPTFFDLTQVSGTVDLDITNRSNISSVVVALRCFGSMLLDVGKLNFYRMILVLIAQLLSTACDRITPWQTISWITERRSLQNPLQYFGATHPVEDLP
jgi:hypothetical protein